MNSDTMSAESENQDQAVRLKRLIRAVQTLQQQLHRVEAKQREPIAIVGMACRFPGANTPDAFWQLLHSGSEAIQVVPPDRWDADACYDPQIGTPGKMVSRMGGFLDQIDQFDAAFFKISPAEAVALDPQQRLLLEVSWEALERANLPPNELPRLTGLFIGSGPGEYAHLIQNRPDGLEHMSMGSGGGSMISGRLASAFNLQGPAYTVDTACSSSLVAVHLAVQSLRNGECDLALVGAVNCLLDPDTSVISSQGGLLSPDGRCKTFDAAADGYGRGEGCGVVILKRLSDAEAAGDGILALIRGTAANHNGQTNGLTAPNGPAQQFVVQQALANAGMHPDEIGYVECHGTGTPLGDAVEIHALGQVFGARNDPLYLGTAKTNVGHLEWAAGLVGICKVVLALQHSEIPPHLHLQTPNPDIAWDDLPFVVTCQHTPWPAGKAAGISAFGANGANAHAILSAYEQASPPASQPASAVPMLLPLSAKTDAALHELAYAYADLLRTNGDLALADVCQTAATGRTHFAQRLALVATSPAEAAQQLAAFVAHAPSAALVDSTRHMPRHRVAFLCSGSGSQYAGMGLQVYATQPAFRAALDVCAEKLQPYLDVSLLEVLSGTGDQERIHQPIYALPALFALDYALAQLWQAWGITPVVLLGHDVGEYVAACLAGVLTLDDALALVAAQGRWLQNASEPDAYATLKQIAYRITYQPAQVPVVSTRSGQVADAELTNPDYWVQHVRQPLQSAAALATLLEQDVTTCLEIGPHPELLALAATVLPADQHEKTLWLSSLQCDHNDAECLLTSLGQAYVHGLFIDWQGVYNHIPRSHLTLPTYPFQRQRYWLPAVPRQAVEQADAVRLYDRPDLQTDYVAPRNTTEALLAAIWQPLIGIEPIGIYDNYFELGGNSLLGTQVLVRIKDAFLIDLPITSLFDYPTIARLSEHVIEQQLVQAENDDLQQILADVAALSEAEVTRQLLPANGLTNAG